MKLFHYCSSKHIKSIKQEGLTRGNIPIIDKWGVPKGIIKPCQWLTSNPAWNQSWARRDHLPYMRNDYKIIVEIPKNDKALKKWQPFCEVPQLASTASALNKFGDPQNWYCYLDEIPIKYFKQIIKNPNN